MGKKKKTLWCYWKVINDREVWCDLTFNLSPFLFSFPLFIPYILLILWIWGKFLMKRIDSCPLSLLLQSFPSESSIQQKVLGLLVSVCEIQYSISTQIRGREIFIFHTQWCSDKKWTGDRQPVLHAGRIVWLSFTNGVYQRIPLFSLSPCGQDTAASSPNYCSDAGGFQSFFLKICENLLSAGITNKNL